MPKTFQHGFGIGGMVGAAGVGLASYFTAGFTTATLIAIILFAMGVVVVLEGNR